MSEQKPQIIPVQYIPYCEEDEIDLKEIIKKILSYKKFIITFTLTITFLAGLYAFLKKPVYETQHTFMLAQINGQPIQKPQNIKEYLSGVYKYDLEKKFRKPPKAYLSQIQIPKNSDLFIKIVIEGLSNDYDLKKRDEVLKTIQKLNENKIKQHTLQILNKIENLKLKLKQVDLFEVKNIKLQIENIKKTIKLKENLINYYKEELETINKKTKYLQETIKKLSDELNKLINNNNKNLTSNILISNKIMTYQNLINQYAEQIQNLNLQKQQIITQLIPKTQNEITNLKEKINELNMKLETVIPQKKENIKTQIESLKLSLKNTFNAKEIGKPLMFDHPVKPKKKLIIIVAFITGFILSIFLVFFIEFIKGLKEEN